jgi:hypothetical protein
MTAETAAKDDTNSRFRRVLFLQTDFILRL